MDCLHFHMVKWNVTKCQSKMCMVWAIWMFTLCPHMSSATKLLGERQVNKVCGLLKNYFGSWKTTQLWNRGHNDSFWGSISQSVRFKSLLRISIDRGVGGSVDNGGFQLRCQPLSKFSWLSDYCIATLLLSGLSWNKTGLSLERE